MSEIPSLERYSPEKHAEIKKIAGVLDVVPGKNIDIVVIQKQESVLLQNAIESIKSDLEAIGVNVEELGFMYAGETTVYNPKPIEEQGVGRYITLGEIGIDALNQLWIATRDKIGAVLPLGFQSLNTFSTPSLLYFIEKIRSFGINPEDLVVGAEFEITTKSSRSASTYILTINEEGLFEIKDNEINRARPDMIGATFRYFNSAWQLVWIGSNRTSPVQTMKKL